MKRYEFHLALSSEEVLECYRGAGRQVLARCFDGQPLQFPAPLLKQFVTSAGVRGDFELICDDHHKGAVLRRLPKPL